MTRATLLAEHLALALGKSRKPLSLSEEELDARLDLLRRRHPELAINLRPCEETWRKNGFAINVQHAASNTFAQRIVDEQETPQLTRGVAFKVCVRACQAVEAMRAP